MIYKIVRLAWFSMPILLLLSVASAFSASLAIPSSRVGYLMHSITVNDLKPPECAVLNLTAIRVGSGVINGGGSNELILGSAGVDTITGNSGSDCIVGGAGDDILKGNTNNAQTTIILGGPGSDDIRRGDYCYGGPGNGPFDVDTFTKCTTIR
jgi:hypothetical protein